MSKWILVHSPMHDDPLGTDWQREPDVQVVEKRPGQTRASVRVDNYRFHGKMLELTEWEAQGLVIQLRKAINTIRKERGEGLMLGAA